MGMILQADDIFEGMIVAVHSPAHAPAMRIGGKDIAMAFGRSESGEPRIMAAPQPELPVQPGVPLRVIATSFPFVACSIIQPVGSEAGPVMVDLRDVRLCRLDHRFVGAIAKYVAEHIVPDAPDTDGSETDAAEKEPQQTEIEF
jgi:hypothetical protein